MSNTASPAVEDGKLNSLNSDLKRLLGSSKLLVCNQGPILGLSENWSAQVGEWDSLSKRLAEKFHLSLLPTGVAVPQQYANTDFSELNQLQENGHFYTSTVQNAFMDLVKMNRDQAIFLVGSNGGQQSFLHRATTRHLVDLTKPGNSKKSKIHSAALKLHTLFNQLLHTSEQNQLKAMADFVVTYQLDSAGQIIGFETKLFGGNYRDLTVKELGKKALVFSSLYHNTSAAEKTAFGISTLHASYFGKDNDVKSKYIPGSVISDLKELRSCFKALGVATSESHQNQLLGLFGAIEVLQILEFHSPSGSSDVAANVINREHLTAAADLLGVTANELEAGLTYQTKALQKDFASKALNAVESRKQRDLLVVFLYESICEWIVHQINRKHAAKIEPSASLTVVQLSGWCADEKVSATASRSINGLVSNFFAERVLQSIYSQVIQAPINLYHVEFQQQNQLLAGLQYNSPVISVISDPANGLLGKLREKPATATVFSRKAKEVVASYPGHIKVTGETQVSIRHTWGYDSVYNMDELVHDNSSQREFIDDIMRLFVGATVDKIQTSLPNTGSKQSVLRSVMQFAAVTFLSAEAQGKFFKTLVDIKDMFEHIEECNIWSDLTAPVKDTQVLKKLQRGLLIPDLARANLQLTFPFDVPRNDIAAKFGTAFASGIGDTVTLAGSLGLAPSLVAVGPNRWFFSEIAFSKFIQLTGGLYKNDLASQLNWMQQSSYYGEDYDSASEVGSEMSGYSGISLNVPITGRLSDATATNRPIVSLADPSLTLEKHLNGKDAPIAPAKKPEKTLARKRWVCCTWCATWWVPSIFLKYCGGMKRKDIQMAWREKLTLNFFIYFCCLLMLFVIIGLNRILCPNTKGKSPGELSNYNKTDQRVYAYGIWLKVSNLESMPYHNGYSYSDWHGVLGIDVTGMFPKSQYYSKYCPLMTTSDAGIDVYSHQLGPALSMIYYQHPISSSSDAWASAVSQCKQGPVYLGKPDYSNLIASNRYWFIINDYVYDLSGYVVAGSYPASLQYKFLGDAFNSKIVTPSLGSGADMSGAYNALLASSNRVAAQKAMNCLNNLFKIGQVDHRKDAKCVVTNWILLAASIIIVAAIGFKFIAALQLPSRAVPEDFDKFVLVQVPCYTEGPESIARTVESVAALKYDDKHKLLFVICDGMIIGSGNDRPTPRIVLDILGVDENVDPTALSYQAVAEGSKQHNMAKIYSGLYSFEGHHIPFITLVKVGTPAEKARPGNRGKRDSQLVLMRFLQKVYFQMPMTPMELELFHQIKNVIGVHPSFYEFVLMIDADTYVLADSLNKLIAAMIRDSKTIGICGETELANERESWITMIQVYEYFISHYLAKAFESMFNSVTCLPGCFCMYRVRTSGQPGAKTSPILISNTVIDAYSETNVNTLHKKNLLHLGEDRYLTTLLLKTFPQYKTNFTANAQCKTVAPNKWSVLLSQRRRWINSTVHNLFELLMLQDLCGFFCFSMRFVVFLDLFGTVTQPAALVYIVYLIVVSIAEDNPYPQISIIMIACIYGLPVLLFLLKRQFEHIGWMLLYICAQPLYGFFMPLYAFWHFDDFSWGNTRMIIGDDGRSKAFVPDEETFDPNTIPRRPFEEYEMELIAHQGALAVDQMNTQPVNMIPQSEASFQQHRLSQYTITNPAFVGSDVVSGRVRSDSASEHTVDINDSISHTGSLSEYRSQAPAVINTAAYIQSRSRPVSQSVDSFAVVGGPSDAELIAAVKSVLASADLMTITKRQVRERISTEYFGGFDLTYRKEFLNQVIDQVLQGQL